MRNNELPLLFCYYPQLIKKLSYIKLTQLPTPVERLTNLGRYLNAPNLWIKRDDKTTNIYGGNKPRKLEFIIPDVKSKKKNEIVTIGGIGSNHCLATTIFAKKENITTTLFLFHQPITKHVKETLLLLKHFGKTKLYYLKNPIRTYIAAYLYSLKNPDTYFLAPGGSTILGCLGYVNAAFELKEQIKNKEMPKPSYIFIPVGTAGSICGLKVGLRLCKLDTKVIGVRVVHRILANKLKLKVTCEKVANFIGRYVNFPPVKFHINEFILLHNYIGAGYGYETKKAQEALNLMNEYENINLDITYTAKTFAAVIDFVKEYNLRNETLLFWNTFNSVDLSYAIDYDNYKKLPVELQQLFHDERNKNYI